jgi:hypothetical protein
MQRKELLAVIMDQMAETGIDDDDFAGDLADRLDTEFALIDEEEDEEEEEF